MSKVKVELSMSLDGFVAGPHDSPENGLGDGGDRLFKRESWLNTGASVTGRRTFDIAGGWGGNPPGGVNAKYFVVTHTVPQEWVKPGSPFTFVTDGVESAVEKAKRAAGDKNVDLMGASIDQQCIKANLLDELQIDLAPVLLGGGVSMFDTLGVGPIELERIRVVEGVDVTQLLFRVVKRRHG